MKKRNHSLNNKLLDMQVNIACFKYAKQQVNELNEYKEEKRKMQEFDSLLNEWRRS